MKMIASILLLLAVAMPSHAARAQSSAGATVWLLGDSITFDYGLYFPAQNPTWVVSNLGAGGETSQGGLARVQTLLATNPAPTIAVLSWGTNDAVWKWANLGPDMEPEDLAARIVAMAILFREAGTFPIIGLPIGFVTYTCSPSPILLFFNQETTIQRQAIIALARENNIEYFGMEHHSQCIWWRDAFHPTSAGSQNDVSPKVAVAIHTHSDF